MTVILPGFSLRDRPSGDTITITAVDYELEVAAWKGSWLLSRSRVNTCEFPIIRAWMTQGWEEYVSAG